MDKFVSAEPFPPGEFIQEELDARGWTQEDLAQVLNMGRRQIANLIAGESALTPETATAIGAAFGQDPKTWMDLQVMYELALAAKKHRDSGRRAAVYSKIPVREVKKRGWILDVDDTDELEAAVCKFLSIDRIEEEPCFTVAARKGTPYGIENSAQIAWYARARRLAELVPASRYVESDFNSALESLRPLLENPEDVRHVPKLLGDMGVRLVLVQHLAKTRIEGAAFWLDSTSPAIALSLRYDRIDNFWFNLLHELIHIKHRHASPIDVENGGGEPHEQSDMEITANSEAADFLVPQEKVASFVKRASPFFYQTRVVQFARANLVHPGIVVGQLHKRDAIKPFQLRKLLEPIREFIVGQTITDGWGNTLWLD